MNRPEPRVRHLASLLPMLAMLVFAAGCGDDDGGTGPAVTGEPTHYDLTLKMSSIWAIENCEATAGDPGEFRYRLILRMPDEFGNQVVIHDTGSQAATIPDGDRQGIVMDAVTFRRINDPDAAFQVEFWIGEYDGSTADFENHSWVNHRLDSGRGQMWAAGSSYETDGYTENADGSGNGLMKFSVWNESDSCKGAAYYYVTWTPVWL